MTQLLSLLLFFTLGVILQKVLTYKKQLKTAYFLNRYVIYISLPALVVVTLSNVEIESRLLLPAITAWGIFALSALSILAASKFFNWERSITGALLLVAPFGNTSFLGIPFTQAFFGEDAIAYAIIYDQLGSFLLLSTAGVVILSLYSSKRATPKEIILKIVTFPSFLALLFTLLGLARYLPLWSFDILKMLASTLTPAALLAIGLLLNFTLPKGKRIAFIFALTLKLLIAPLLLYALFALLGLHSLVAKVTLFEAAMAPMVSSSMLAIMANLEKRFVASTLGVGIIVSFVTLPLFYLLIETL